MVNLNTKYQCSLMLKVNMKVSIKAAWCHIFNFMEKKNRNCVIGSLYH